METNTIIALFLAGLLLFLIGGYIIWMKSQDQTKSLEGEVIYSAKPYPIIINHSSTNLSLVPKPAIERAKEHLLGGNRKASEEQKTGRITCLESCWISISSNANYPQTGPIKRFLKPNSRFRGRADVLTGDGKPVILIYRVASAK